MKYSSPSDPRFFCIVLSPGFPHVSFNGKYGVGLRISRRGFSRGLFTLGYRDGRFWINDGGLRVEDCLPFVTFAHVYARCPIRRRDLLSPACAVNCRPVCEQRSILAQRADRFVGQRVALDVAICACVFL